MKKLLLVVIICLLLVVPVIASDTTKVSLEKNKLTKSDKISVYISDDQVYLSTDKIAITSSLKTDGKNFNPSKSVKKSKALEISDLDTTITYELFKNRLKETIVIDKDMIISFPMGVSEGYVLIPWYNGEFKIVEESLKNTEEGVVIEKPFGWDALRRNVPMKYTKSGNTLTLVYDKNVIVNGSSTSIVYPLTIDPTWVYVNNWVVANISSGWIGRSGHSMAVTSLDTLILMGGYSISDRLNDTWISSNGGITWTQTNASSGWVARSGHSSVALPNNSVLVMGGIYTIGGFTTGVSKDVWMSSTDYTRWYNVNPSAAWGGRYYHSSVITPNGTILLFGGYSETGFLQNDVWGSTDNGTTWVQVCAAAGWSARSRHTTVVFPNSTIILAGGGSKDVWISIDNGSSWTQQTSTAGWAERLGHACVVLPDDSIVIIGGCSADGLTFFNDVWKSTDMGVTWEEVSPYNDWAKRSDFSAVSLANGTVVLTGGENQTVYSRNNETWISYPKLFTGVSFTFSPINGTSPLTVQFNDTSTVDIPTSWNWSMDGTWYNFSAPATDARNISHTFTYTTPTTYNHTANLTIYSVGAPPNTTWTNVSVFPPFPVDFTANPLVGISGTLTTFTSTEIYNASDFTDVKYNWSFGDYSYEDLGAVVTHAYAYYGTFDVNLTITANRTCDNATIVNFTKKDSYVIITSSALSAWYSPHQVTFTVMNNYGVPQPNLTINATFIVSTFPDQSWLSTIYGVSSATATQMMSNNLSMIGNTRTDGSVTFTMHASLVYGVNITGKISGVDIVPFYVELQPSDDDYTIWLRYIASNVSWIAISPNATLTMYQPNISWATFGVDYYDVYGLTSLLEFELRCQNNNTVVYATSINPGISRVLLNTTIPNIRGQRWIWKYNAVRV